MKSFTNISSLTFLHKIYSELHSYELNTWNVFCFKIKETYIMAMQKPHIPLTRELELIITEMADKPK